MVLKKKTFWGASYFPSNVTEAVVKLCQSNGAIQWGEKWANQTPRLEAQDWAVTFSICELRCWHQSDGHCAVQPACEDPTGKHRTKTRPWYPALTLFVRLGLTLLWSLTNTLLPVTRYHRELNGPLARCGLFIDGPPLGMSISQGGEDNSWLPPGNWVTPAYSAESNGPILAFSHREKTLQDKASWGEGNFIFDWKRDTLPAMSHRKEWNKSLWANLIILLERSPSDIWCTPCQTKFCLKIQNQY